MKAKLLTLAALLLLLSCKEDDPEPTGAEKQGVLLAGEKGKSKNWVLTGGTAQETGGPVQTFNFDACFTDNIYTFNNNDAQSYVNTEGASKCDATHPSEIEKGTWAITLDGEIVIVVASSISNPEQSLFGALASPMNVLSLTKDEMEGEYKFEGVTYTFKFESSN